MRQRPSPGQSPAEGSRPLPMGRTIDGCSRQPPGRACPAPTARRPGNGCPRKPRSVSISPSVGRGALTPPRPPAAANNNPCLPPWGKVAPQGRMRGRLPLPLIPGQTVGGGVPDAPETLRQRPSPGQSPAEGSRPLPMGRTIDGCSRQPPGRACPAPTARRPGNGCPRKPHSILISPSVGRGAPPRRDLPPPPTAREGLQPLPSPLGEGGPAGPDEGQAPVTAHSRANRRGRRPRRPAKPSANGHPPGSHPRRGQDPSLRAEPLTGAHANSRAGHARPLPGDNPAHLYTT